MNIFFISGLLIFVTAHENFSNNISALWKPENYKINYTEPIILINYEDDYKLYLDLSRNKTVYEIITNGLNDYNAKKTGQTSFNYCTISITSSSGELIAGLNSDIYTSQALGNFCQIHNIWVSEAHQRCGLGTFIIRKLIEYIQSKNCFIIQVEELYESLVPRFIRDLNDEAKNNIFENIIYEYQYNKKDNVQNFFEKLGFVNVATIPNPNLISEQPICILRKKIDKSEALYDFSPHYDYVEKNNFTYKLEENWNNYVSLTLLAKLETHYSLKKEYNYSTSNNNQFSMLFIESDLGEIIAGMVFRIFVTKESSYCVINKLWVSEKYRKNNFGKKLMHAVEQYAKNKKCYCIQLDTWQWQAKNFYEKLGYNTIATVPNPENCTEGEQYFMRKILSNN